MLKRIPNVARRWIPSSRTPQEQWIHADTMEMQTPLAAEPSKNENTADTSYQLHHFHSKKSTLQSLPKVWVERLLGPRFAGWRFGVLNFAIWSTCVFLINFIVTIWGATATKNEKGVFLEGDCDRVRRLNTGLHVLINILSTVLVSGSNYCMQVCSAPTRRDIDQAHGSANGIWLDIGVPGFRNLRHISRHRTILWCLLGLSSLPLHLFYNSAVYASISSNDYRVYSVSQSFINDTKCLGCEHDYRTWTECPYVLPLWSKAKTGQLERLEPSECLDQYAQIIQSNRQNLLLVANDRNFPPPEENLSWNGTRVYDSFSYDATSIFDVRRVTQDYKWICSNSTPSGPCPEGWDCSNSTPSRPCTEDIKKIKSLGIESWRVGKRGWPVEYCLSEKVQPHCKLHFELSIAIIIVILNLIKAALMFFIAFRIHDEPLITIGDAVASFLNKTDPTTKNMCLSNLQDLKKKQGYSAGPRQWINRQYRWKDTTSKTRRIVTFIMFLIALAIISYLLAMILLGIDRTLLVSLGFGSVDPRAFLLGLPSNVLILVLITNTPQFVLTFLYFSYNALFTGMLTGYEWTSYAYKRKGLRVSDKPSGEQRSTYFLQLPYRFSVPLMMLSATLHWLLSQSIFLVALDFYNAPSSDPEESTIRSYKTLGFSPMAIISVTVLGGLMAMSIIAFGFVPYKRGMTLAGSCSVSISAACHTVGEDGAAKKKLQWGVVSTDCDGVGHCAFSTREVDAPVKGELYAGLGI